jgi:hypothetical protein
MRFYDITAGGWHWTSHPGGQHDPGALQIEMMVELYGTPDPTPNSTIEIHGVPWDYIKYTNTLIDTQCTVFGGMAPGLLLATFQARNPRFLGTGKIIRAWGNWIGTNMSIGMQLMMAGTDQASGGGGGGSGGGGGGDGGGGAGGQSVQSAQNIRFNRTGPRSIFQNPSVSALDSTQPPLADISLQAIADALAGKAAIPNIIGSEIPNQVAGGFPGLTNPLNLSWNLQPNQPFQSAISETLSRALPGVPLRIAVSPNLKLAYQDAAMYQNLEQFIGHLRDLSQSVLGAVQGKQNYPGIRASSDGRSLDVWDATSQFGSIYIDPLDLIGQPTWVNRLQIQIKIVMRGEIRPNDTVVLPDTLATVEQGAIWPGTATTPQRRNLSLSGSFTVVTVRHIGDFRNPDGNNWCTLIDAWPKDLIVGLEPITLSDVQQALQSEALGLALQSVVKNMTPQSQSRLMQRRVRNYG